MSDPLRSDGSDLDRDAKIEQLLLVGLDHYFAAQYDQAINVWTRALFLDRSHARARAYIERARSALAERQRQSEELLQHGVAAFQRGEGDEARRLLEAAIHQGAPSDQALAVLERINRVEQSATPQLPAALIPSAGSRAFPGVAAAARQSRLGVLGWLLLAALVVAAAAVIVGPSAAEWWSALPLQPAPAAQSAPAVNDPGLPIPLRGETALAQARALAATGHVRDALNALDLVRLTDPQRPDADRLRADLQRQLIALSDAAGGQRP
jgi:tetratricopeptide (TPR) repeat protein